MLNMSINNMDLSVRSKLYLERLGFKKVKDINLNLVEFSNIINYGLKTKQEIINEVKKLNLNPCYNCMELTDRIPNEDQFVLCQECHENS